MRASRTVIVLTTAALFLAGCSDSSSPEAEQSPTESAAPSPTEAEAVDLEPTEAPTTEAPAATTDLPATALLSQEAFYPKDGVRTEREGVETWLLPSGCEALTPGTAAAMRTVIQGDGAYEDSVGQQQVAVFADVDAAVAEADRLGGALAACAGDADHTTTFATEPVAVGAQGVGLVVSYYGNYVPGQDEMSLGYFLTVTRRGNAVTLVTNAGGEDTIKGSREVVVTELQAAWELLCAYDSSGC